LSAPVHFDAEVGEQFLSYARRVSAMHRFAEAIIYPTRAEQVMRTDDA
jgi:hypothetical protein